MFGMPTTWTSFLAKTYLVVQSLAFIIITNSLPTNNTTHVLPALTSSNKVGLQCTKSETWIADGFRPHDCNTIIDLIYETEVLQRKDARFEFTSPGSTTTKTDWPKIGTPRKYVYKSCVVTVAMLDQFRPRELPGSDFRERYEETDVAGFSGLWEAALKAYFECVRFGHAGWSATGESLLIVAR